MIGRGSVSAEICTRQKESRRKLSHHRNRRRSRSVQRARFDNQDRELRGKILGTLYDDALCSEQKTAKTCRSLRNERYSLFVIAPLAKVSATNNAAEQALRRSVIFRKLSFGREEKTGSQNLAVILAVTETCRRVRKRPYDDIMGAIKPVFINKAAPNPILQR